MQHRYVELFYDGPDPDNDNSGGNGGYGGGNGGYGGPGGMMAGGGGGGGGGFGGKFLKLFFDDQICVFVNMSLFLLSLELFLSNVSNVLLNPNT